MTEKTKTDAMDDIFQVIRDSYARSGGFEDHPLQAVAEAQGLSFLLTRIDESMEEAHDASLEADFDKTQQALYAALGVMVGAVHFMQRPDIRAKYKRTIKLAKAIKGEIPMDELTEEEKEWVKAEKEELLHKAFVTHEGDDLDDVLEEIVESIKNEGGDSGASVAITRTLQMVVEGCGNPMCVKCAKSSQAERAQHLQERLEAKLREHGLEGEITMTRVGTEDAEEISQLLRAGRKEEAKALLEKGKELASSKRMLH